MTKQDSVILVDDEDDVRRAGRQTLELEGFQVLDFPAAEPALDHITEDWPGVVVTDLRMPKVDGLELFARIRKIDRDLPVILVSAHGDIATAVQAMRDGAYDFIEKPAAPDQLVETIRRALEKRRLVLENRSLKRELESFNDISSRLLGNGAVIDATRRSIASLATTDVDVLIMGETGTGKELAARSLHDFGPRRDEPFVALNCGALPENIVESELFGYERGAFTGATHRRIGKIQHANGGTLFLDEIESMPASLQVKLLRVLQERVVERLGSNEPQPVNIRVIAAAKSDLKALCEQGTFREDLYYRLNVVSLVMPTLRERPEDIPLLFCHFAAKAAARYDRPVVEPSAEILAEMANQPWPGNVRELQNAADRYALGIAADLPETLSGTPQAPLGADLSARMDAFEKQAITQALKLHDGHLEQSAEYLGMPRKKLYLRMRKHGLHREDFK